MDADYLNQQAYLDAKFKDVAVVTDTMLQSAKAEWKRLYITRYHKQYRVDYVQISFRLSKPTYEKLKAKAGNNKPTSYCKALVLKDVLEHSTEDTQSIKLEVLQLIDAIEEAQFEKEVLEPDTILKTLHHILEQFL